MDHITRCPHCSTAFRVSDAQLAAFQGKVRCGRCAFVFNARDSLIRDVPSQAAVKPIENEIPANSPATPSPANNKAIDTGLATAAPQFAISASTQDAPAAPSLDALGQDNNSADESKAAISPLLSESLLTPAEKKKGDAPPPSLDDTWQTDKSTEQVSARQTESKPKPSSTIWPEELITQTQQTGAYQPIALPEDEALFAPLASKPRSRAWGWLSLILTLGLALQLIYFNRVRIAMEFPALQPRFTTLCEKLYCDMPLPRDASQLRLEWSELSYVPDHQTRIQLSATLRNLALYNQALPKMELTLTDKLEGIVARRVFQPEEYLSAAEKKRTQLGAYDELHAYVELDIGELKSTGYSLYWFYD